MYTPTEGLKQIKKQFKNNRSLIKYFVLPLQETPTGRESAQMGNQLMAFKDSQKEGPIIKISCVGGSVCRGRGNNRYHRQGDRFDLTWPHRATPSQNKVREVTHFQRHASGTENQTNTLLTL